MKIALMRAASLPPTSPSGYLRRTFAHCASVRWPRRWRPRACAKDSKVWRVRVLFTGRPAESTATASHLSSVWPGRQSTWNSSLLCPKTAGTRLPWPARNRRNCVSGSPASEPSTVGQMFQASWLLTGSLLALCSSSRPSFARRQSSWPPPPLASSAQPPALAKLMLTCFARSGVRVVSHPPDSLMPPTKSPRLPGAARCQQTE
mmetsp:Transcript_69907/g.193279  ORF Transcript_69907/g.193279 Transcript_69907/m.193279 type:complete len:204 (-) Transcript_69907:586-1197(-)